MSKVDHSMSLTPPADMNKIERIGALVTGLGILALLVAFLGATPISPFIALGFGGAMLVAAGVLRGINKEKFKGLSLLMLAGGVISLVLMFLKMNLEGWVAFAAVFGVTAAGATYYFWGAFGKGPAGIKNNGIFHSSATRQAGVLSWVLAILFTGFYVVLYWFPDQLFGLVAAADPLYHLLTGNHSYWVDDKGMGHVTNQWFSYGLLYTVGVLVMGFRYILKYRHSNYQILRTISVMSAQLLLAFLLPHFLEQLNTTQNNDFKAYVKESYYPVFAEYDGAKNAYFEADGKLEEAKKAGGDASLLQAEADSKKAVYESKRAAAQGFNDELHKHAPTVASHYLTYFWPLDYDIIQPDMITYYTGEVPWDNVYGANSDGSVYSKMGFGGFGWGVIIFSILMSTVGVVVLTYFFGKRWYCSWVCGCGGLAETAGDAFRQQSDKSLKAWRIERYTIHGVLALVSVVTALLLIDWQVHFLGDGVKGAMKSGYGFLIASSFAGVVGTGFYPIMGSRVWCRFGCPQAAVLGLLQKYFSRFRITTNGGQCISCGNCSTYCEMGIDVKWYAQRGQDIARTSCVGCGVCSAVCPRGVLNLENGPRDTRKTDLMPLTFEGNSVVVNG